MTEQLIRALDCCFVKDAIITFIKESYKYCGSENVKVIYGYTSFTILHTALQNWE